MEKGAEPRARVPELDGLRGIAIGPVLVYHFFLIPSNPQPGTFFAYLLVPGRLAWSGVDLFFVLSGFLIGGILLHERDSPNYFRAFYTRRFFRIIPMYTVTLVFFYGLMFIVRAGYAKNFASMLNDQLPWYSYPVFIQNFWMMFRDTLGPSTLGVTWSLAIEELYLTLPLLAGMYLCILLYGIIFSESFIGKFLRMRWLRSLGLIAYGLYLMHFPVQGMLFGLKWGRAPFISSVSTAALNAFGLIATVAICALSWKYFENPLIKLGHRVSYQDLSTARVQPIATEIARDVGS